MRRRELIRLIGEQVVVVRTGGSGFGTGFLVSGDTVLTCAHVVHGHASVEVVTGSGAVGASVVETVPAERGAGAVFGFPDLARLSLNSPMPGFGVWLGDQTPLPGHEVVVHGFSRHTLEAGEQPDTLHLVVAGQSSQFVRLQWDMVVQGFSGGPVLDLRTGRICGVLKASRDERGPQGGWLVPVEAVWKHFPDLAARNAKAHVPGTPWCDAALGRARRQGVLFGAPGRNRRDTVGSDAQPTPAQLLAHGTMPFVDRPELGELLAWCEEGAERRLRLLHAPGGAGKTRLATELCRTLTERGWIAGFVQKDAPVRQEWLEELTDALDAGLCALVVFDYAQVRLEEISALLEHAYRYGPEGMRLRLLLLARSDEPLFQALRRRVSDPALPETSVVALPRTIESEGNGPLARRAFSVFADRLGCGWLTPPGRLAARAEWQDSVLDVLALALDAVLTLRQGGPWTDHGDPLERVCDHELRGWHALVAVELAGQALASPGSAHLSESLLLVPTLVQGLAGPKLIGLLERVHAASPGQPPIFVDGVYKCLRTLYPAPGGQVAPLEPDRIGEILVRQVLSQPEGSGCRTAYLSTLLDASTSEDTEVRISAAADTMEVLARARGCTTAGRIESHPAHPALDSALREAVARRPDVLLPALTITGALLPHAEPLATLALPLVAECGRELLESVDSRLPDYPSGLSPVAVVVLDRLLTETDGRLTEDRQLLRLRRLVRYSLRSDDTGARQNALAAGRDAVDLSRDLVQQSGRHLAEYATALNNLSLLLHRAGSTASALAESRSAVGLYEQLLEQTPPDRGRSFAADRQMYLLNTAAALSTLALLRLTDGQVHAAAQEAQRSVSLCRQALPSVRQEDILLGCLDVLAECQQRTGLLNEAVVTAGEAVALLRDLAERQPQRYLDRLPIALHRQARGLIRAGAYPEAYHALHEAVALLSAHADSTPLHRETRLRSLRALAELCIELPEFSHERITWLEQLESHIGRAG
ncbi:trypsin-like serine peptidase [Streptomyces sp. NPDC059766]|uniref:trypsin-like serine peptidase n=1 Tax=Streptomyces sp. NPDC059766 TaxID=3346940 RepID=UPI00364C1C1B